MHHDRIRESIREAGGGHKSLSGGRIPPPDVLKDLSELSQAGHTFLHATASERDGRKKRPHVLPPLVAGLLVGFALLWGGGFSYKTAALIYMGTGAEEGAVARHAQALLQFAQLQDMQGKQPACPADWRVRIRNDNVIELALISSGSRGSVNTVGVVAASYIEAVQQMEENARRTPTESEQLLGELIANLESRMEDTGAHLSLLEEALPDDPRAGHVALLDQWRRLRADFADRKSRLDQAVAALAEAQSQPEPTQGLVSAQRRNEAIQADQALQQDLSELSVNLAELRAQVLQTRRSCAAKLADLEKAAHKLAEPADCSDNHPEPAAPSGLQGDVERFSCQYRELVGRFRDAWNEFFTQIEATQVDPLTCTVLEAHATTAKLLNDFLFRGANTLSGLRKAVFALTENMAQTPQAAHPRADVARVFEELQQRHHAFEFAAVRLEPRSNFRIDAAWNAARGLRRRSRERIQRIDAELRRLALAEARQNRLAAIDEARRRCDAARRDFDEIVAGIVSLQAELNDLSAQTVAFLDMRQEHALANAAKRWAKENLNQAQSRMENLQRKRQTMPGKARLQVLSVDASTYPENLGERLRLGGTMAGLAAVLVWLAQWWTGRTL